MFLYEITFWSRTANSEKHTANENSGLITIGVSNNLWEVRRQGFDGIDAKQINCPYELCNITRMLDCNSEKKRTWLKTYRKKNWSRTLWSLILLVKDAWRLILLVKDALMSYLTDQERFDVLSYWSRTLWRLILLVKDVLTSYLIDQGRFDLLSYCSRTLWRLTLLFSDALKSHLIVLRCFEVLYTLLFSDALKSYIFVCGRFEV